MRSDLAFAFLIWSLGVSLGLVGGMMCGLRLGHDDCVLRGCEGRCERSRASLAHNWSMDWRQWDCRCLDGE